VLLRDTLRSAIDRLAKADVPSPRLNAELLLMFVLHCDRAYFHAHPERELTPEEIRRYDEALAKRASGIPAQYITGHQEFWGLDFIVSPAVLIPRPETEHIIETVLALVGRTLLSAKIVDIATGSGCIAIALATELPDAEIHATDISKAALEVARTNAARLGQSRIQFHESDLFSKLETRNFETGSFDFVVSNPPYVGESEEEQVQLEVRKHEPHNAVFAGPTGLEIIERLIPQAHDALKPSGWLVMEISGAIVEGVKILLSGWKEIQITNDLQGIPRVVSAKATP
jgi:release factor glutamine methyltransferase